MEVVSVPVQKLALETVLAPARGLTGTQVRLALGDKKSTKTNFFRAGVSFANI